MAQSDGNGRGTEAATASASCVNRPRRERVALARSLCSVRRSICAGAHRANDGAIEAAEVAAVGWAVAVSCRREIASSAKRAFATGGAARASGGTGASRHGTARRSRCCHWQPPLTTARTRNWLLCRAQTSAAGCGRATAPTSAHPFASSNTTPGGPQCTARAIVACGPDVRERDTSQSACRPAGDPPDRRTCNRRRRGGGHRAARRGADRAPRTPARACDCGGGSSVAHQRSTASTLTHHVGRHVLAARSERVACTHAPAGLRSIGVKDLHRFRSGPPSSRLRPCLSGRPVVYFGKKPCCHK
eukprot:scaffold29262_cov107-Isochrysis_galbana.AAC.1